MTGSELRVKYDFYHLILRIFFKFYKQNSFTCAIKIKTEKNIS